MKKRRSKPTKLADGDIPLDGQVDRAIRAFVTHAEAVIRTGEASPPLLQALVSLRRQAQQRNDGLTRPAVVEWFRELEPNDRANLVRELQQIDSKRSGLA